MFHSRIHVVRAGKDGIRSFQRTGYLFIPGLFFILIGLVAVFAPMLLIGAIAAFFISLGLIFCVLTWKFLRLRRNSTRIISQTMRSKRSIQKNHLSLICPGMTTVIRGGLALP